MRVAVHEDRDCLDVLGLQSVVLAQLQRGVNVTVDLPAARVRLEAEVGDLEVLAEPV